jgi:hypothetical protein
LGGSAGTTYDAFKLLAEAKKHGAKAALYGRKINNAEHQLSFIQFLRWIADGEVAPEEAVHAYHGVLQRLGIAPWRPLDRDMQLTDPSMSYAGSGRTISIPRPPAAHAPAGAKEPDLPRTPDGNPDFAKMTPAQRLAYHRRRLSLP